MSRQLVRPQCHPEEKNGGRGLCTTCYNREYRRRAGPERDREYATGHRPERLAYARVYYLRNKDKWAYDRFSPEQKRRRLERGRSYRASHTKAISEYMRAYFKANLVRWQVLGSARRARQRAASGTFTVKEWREKCELFAYRCAYCGKAAPLTVDHRIPLTRGGTNEIRNIVPACGLCNRRKNVLTDTEFLAAS